MRNHILHLCQAVAVVLLLGLAGGPAMSEEIVRVGVLAFRPQTEVQERWQPLIEHLNHKVGEYRFELRAMKYTELEQAIAKREVDFVFTNPAHYVLMTYRNALSSPLATLVPMEEGQALSGFGGVVFTRADHEELKRLSDLRGRTVAAVFQGSLGGYLAEAMEMLRAGVQMPYDVRLLETGMPHDAVVQAVLEGRAEAGFVRTGVLEAMAFEGKIKLDSVRILNRQRQEGFPFILSTRLYPEWPIAAMPHTNEDLARRVTATLLAIHHGGELAKALDIHGFTIPQDYEPVRTLLQTLRLPPFEAAPQFTAQDVWHKYLWELLVAAVMAGMIVLLLFWMLVLNRRLGVERKRVARQSEERHRLLAALGEGVYGVDSNGLCTFINPAALQMLGFEYKDVLGKNQHALFHYEHEDGSDYPVTECPIHLALHDGVMRHTEEWFLHKEGFGFPVLMTVTPVGGADEQDGVVVVFRDISERVQMESELRSQATTDALTGLSNRRHFLSEMERELARIHLHPEHSSALLMVDLDNFKRINDSYGHATGDGVLKHFATLLATTLRKSDPVGRWGGEEFCVLLPDNSLEHARHLAERLRVQVASAFVASEAGELRYTVSVGVTMMLATDSSVDTVLARADAALYRAKAGGRNQVATELRH